MSEEKKVYTVYCRTHCTPCNFVKKYMDDHGIKYEEKNIDTDAAYGDELKSLGFQGVPVVVGDGMEPIHGFLPEKLAELK